MEKKKKEIFEVDGTCIPFKEFMIFRNFDFSGSAATLPK